MVASRARQLIGAASIADRLTSVTTVTPATESQARPLTRLTPAQQPIACQRTRRNLSDAELVRCVAELDKRKARAEATAVARDAKSDPQHCGTEGASAAATAAALKYAIGCQRNRRNLTDAELVRCVAELDKRKAVGRPAQGEMPQPCGITGRTAEATAAALGISQRKVEQIRTIAHRLDGLVRAYTSCPSRTAIMESVDRVTT